MTAPRHRILLCEDQIAARVETLADEIVQSPLRPGIAAPVLAGAFVFAADLMRALARRGLSLPMEFLWLRSYGAARTGADEIDVLAAPGEPVRGLTVLLIDGILDRGRTLAKARELLRAAGAAAVLSAVAVERGRADAVIRADFAAFTGLEGFLVGYGMDDAGGGRGLPYIARVD